MIYLDHAATTPLRPEVRDAWLAAHETIGNASSIHGAGQDARRLLEDARERLAAVLHAQPIEVVFTSGGTESVGLALQGLWRARRAGNDGIVLPDGEHHSVLDTAAWLAAREGARVVPVGIDAVGRIPAPAFAAAVGSGAIALATAIAAGNESGTINDVASLAAAAGEAGVPLHVDAVSAFGHVPVSFARWRGDAPSGAGLVALSVSGHKLGAPVGTGALVVSRTAALEPLLHGGGQQRGLRAGTQDVAGAVALATAAERAEAEREDEAARLGALREEFLTRLGDALPEAQLLGDPIDRLPGTILLLLPGAAGESLLFLLDQAGIAVSTGSACQAGVAEPSHVVLAMGRSEAEARQVLRITLGRTTTPDDLDALLRALPDAYRRLGR
ncbi:cysteine desulfurase family protein [Microbacterium sediminis]|uniref:Cysteine desulfurase n=1 Tax=Microbacterium sediminis TaxID=904291 RepID=A0A1B9NF66_9MICO|nr:cysteine desulfurase family protein [Microbacterium sediminis]OCG75239.1 cysteine desulfurase [Microbacterium sediminis]QBR74254.1 cysteine desulfurase [Microbacterium sediminis]